MRRYLLIVLFFGASVHADPRAVLITTDCGTEIDDQWAIVHLARDPAVNLRGVVGGFAPNDPYVDSAKSAACARDALARANRPDVRVTEGHSRPLAGGGADVPAGVRMILDESKEFSRNRRLLIAGLGAMTDLAAALRLDPRVGERVELAALAFDAFPEGGDGWNVQNDVPAWADVLESSVPVTILTGPTAMKYLWLTNARALELFGRAGALGGWLVDLHRGWIEREGDLFAEDNERILREQGVDIAARGLKGRDVWPVWDEAVTAFVLGLTEQIEIKRPRLNGDITFRQGVGGARFARVTKIDAAALYRSLRQDLDY